MLESAPHDLDKRIKDIKERKANKKSKLIEAGFIVGGRDSRRNTAFKGKFMVAKTIDESLLPTECACNTGWCVVGNNLEELMDQTINHYCL